MPLGIIGFKRPALFLAFLVDHALQIGTGLVRVGENSSEFDLE